MDFRFTYPDYAQLMGDRRPQRHYAEGARSGTPADFADGGDEARVLHRRRPGRARRPSAGRNGRGRDGRRLRGDRRAPAEGRRQPEGSRRRVVELRLGGRRPELVVDVVHGVRIGGRRGPRLSIIFGRGPSLRIPIRVPHGSSLDIATESADVTGSGRFDDADVRSASGDVRLDVVDGEASVKSVSGDVLVGSVGGGAHRELGLRRHDRRRRSRAPAPAHRLRRHRGAGEPSSLHLKTISGDARVGSAAEGEVTMQSVSGDLTVGLRSGSKLWVDARSTSGKTTSELEVGDEPPAERRPARRVPGEVGLRRHPHRPRVTDAPTGAAIWPKGGLWRHPDFLKLWSAETISQVGSQVSGLALPLVAIITLDASAFEVALLGVVEFAPFILVSLPAGVWVDRLPTAPDPHHRRPRPGGAARDDPDRVRLRRADDLAAVRRRLPLRRADGVLRRRVPVVLARLSSHATSSWTGTRSSRSRAPARSSRARHSPAC